MSSFFDTANQSTDAWRHRALQTGVSSVLLPYQTVPTYSFTVSCPVLKTQLVNTPATVGFMKLYLHSGHLNRTLEVQKQ